ncbi:MAG: hypothetical protein WD176_03510, partial [Pirellulales bacterium]
MAQRFFVAAVCLSIVQLAAAAERERGPIELPLRTRVNKQPVDRREKIDPRHVGIVVIDLWDYHWCMTCTQRVASMTPRMNRAFDGARRLGMQVILAPTTGIVPYQDWPQRKAVKAMPDHDWPPLGDVKLIAG